MEIFLKASRLYVAAALFCSLGFGNSMAQAPSAADTQQPLTIEITATDYEFTPSEFTVPPGAKVKVTLLNKGRKDHNIQFDMPDNQKLKLARDIKAGESMSLEFTAPGPGTFTFICPVGMHSTIGMKGRMIVE